MWLLVIICSIVTVMCDKGFEITTRTGRCKEVGTPVLGLVNEKCLMTGQILFFVPSHDTPDAVTFATVIDLSVDCDKYGWLFGKNDPVSCMLVKEDNGMVVHKWQPPGASIGDSFMNTLFGFLYNLGASPEWIFVTTYALFVAIPRNIYEYIDVIFGVIIVTLVVYLYKYKFPKMKEAKKKKQEENEQVIDVDHTSIQTTTSPPISTAEMPSALEWDEFGKPMYVNKKDK